MPTTPRHARHSQRDTVTDLEFAVMSGATAPVEDGTVGGAAAVVGDAAKKSGKSILKRYARARGAGARGARGRGLDGADVCVCVRPCCWSRLHSVPIKTMTRVMRLVNAINGGLLILSAILAWESMFSGT